MVCLGASLYHWSMISTSLSVIASIVRCLLCDCLLVLSVPHLHGRCSRTTCRCRSLRSAHNFHACTWGKWSAGFAHRQARLFRAPDRLSCSYADDVFSPHNVRSCGFYVLSTAGALEAWGRFLQITKYVHVQVGIYVSE